MTSKSWNGAQGWGELASEYRSWQAMKNRCLNKRGQDYKYYGARGIAVYPPWVEHFEAFLIDMGPKPQRGLTLERKDTNEAYSPWNCEWATRKTQARNRRYCRLDMAKAMAIRAKYKRGVTRQQDLAVRFNVSQAHVSHVVLGKAWT